MVVVGSQEVVSEAEDAEAQLACVHVWEQEARADDGLDHCEQQALLDASHLRPERCRDLVVDDQREPQAEHDAVGEVDRLTDEEAADVAELLVPSAANCTDAGANSSPL